MARILFTPVWKGAWRHDNWVSGGVKFFLKNRLFAAVIFPEIVVGGSLQTVFFSFSHHSCIARLDFCRGLRQLRTFFGKVLLRTKSRHCCFIPLIFRLRRATHWKFFRSKCCVLHFLWESGSYILSLARFHIAQNCVVVLFPKIFDCSRRLIGNSFF